MRRTLPIGLLALVAACAPQGPDRDGFVTDAEDRRADFWDCRVGDMRCVGNVHEWCEEDNEFIVIRSRDCSVEGLVCVQDPPVGCAPCVPENLACRGQEVILCDEHATGWTVVDWCNPARGEACHNGRCVSGCEHAEYWKSNVGCIYYAVDLDNAALNHAENASAQQFAVAVSNPSDLTAIVTVERNLAGPGDLPDVEEVDRRELAPGDLSVFLLERREVDGSSLFGLNDGTHTALTSRAYRITSTAPIVVYQFNPLENVDVFSNDASILLPATAAGEEYVVLGWPQTIADTPFNRDTDMGLDARSFVAVVGTEAETNVRIELPLTDTLRVAGDGIHIPDLWGGDVLEVVLDEFDVLNLESADHSFGADFTGTVVLSNKPVTVFSGNEASDVPFFETLLERRCCADHLEQQLYPANTSGRSYVVGHTPYRMEAVSAAGGEVSVHEEVEYFRILALDDDTLVRTTLPEHPTFHLDKGQQATFMSRHDFAALSDKPITLGQFTASQQNLGLHCAYPDEDIPGGDPCFILVSPVEQWRSEYVFLTPGEYAFDFVIITHAAEAEVTLDGASLPPTCRTSSLTDTSGEAFAVTRCQLSFPVVGATGGVLPGDQDDGVHVVSADRPVGLVAYGFDCRVSYGYPGGTDLMVIN